MCNCESTHRQRKINTMKRILAILSIMIISTFGYTQTQSVAIPTEQKTIQYTNGREVFNICKANQTVSYKEDLEYYWYNEYSKVKITKGGAGGNLLHGKYQFFDEKGNLIREANFYLGLKDGVEKTWDTDGKIKETYKFNKGKLVYSKFKSEDNDNFIEWNGPALVTGSVKKIYTSYGHLEQTEEVLEGFKFKVTVFFYDGKVKKKYTTGLLDWMYEEYIEYYENGKIKLYGKFEENWRIGDWKWYKEDGSIDTIEKYRINRQYYPDNKIMTEGGEYFDTSSNEWKRNGLWIWYKENGKDLEETKEYEYGVEVEKK